MKLIYVIAIVFFVIGASELSAEPANQGYSDEL